MMNMVIMIIRIITRKNTMINDEYGHDVHYNLHYVVHYFLHYEMFFFSALLLEGGVINDLSFLCDSQLRVFNFYWKER